MIALESSGIDAFNEVLSLELLRLDQEISAAFVGWTREIFGDVVVATPQFSSDATRNWRYSVGQPDLTYIESPEKYLFAQPHHLLQPHAMGDPDAVAEALENMRTVPMPTWRDEVFISNSTPIADALQTGQVKLRPVNMVTAGVIMLDYAIMQAELRGLSV